MQRYKWVLVAAVLISATVGSVSSQEAGGDGTMAVSDSTATVTLPPKAQSARWAWTSIPQPVTRWSVRH
jgi:hypothetical protein